MSEIFRVQIRDLNERGQGVGIVMLGDDQTHRLQTGLAARATVEGKVCFVDGALPGEIVRARLREEKKKFMVLDLIDVETPSPDRCLSDCKYSPECGSCQLRHLSYEAELRLKEKRVYELLSRVGSISPTLPMKEAEATTPEASTNMPHSASQSSADIPEALTVFRPIIGMNDPYHYRGKTIFPIDAVDGTIVIGQYRRGTNNLVDIHTCHIQSEVSIALANAVREFANHDRVTAYDKETFRGSLRHLVVRTAFSSKQVMLVFVVNDHEADHAIESWIPSLEMRAKREGFMLSSVWINRQTTRSNRILSEDYRHLWGDETIEETINGVRYRISPDSFFQVNPVQAAVLFHEVIQAAGLKSNETALDLYCGVGAISLQLAHHAKHTHGGKTIRVLGVDNVPSAIEDARLNAALNGIDNVEFIESDASEWLLDDEHNAQSHVIIVDPPRKGLDPTSIDIIKASNCDRLVYVSCNPATLARDLSLLSETFKVESIQPVDMFPRTMHVETVVLMSRK